MKHLFIINPIAGGGNKKTTAEAIEAIRSFEKQTSDSVEIYYTKAPMDACRKIIEEAETPNASMLYVYAYGGDGTLNECVNGAAGRTNVAVTSYPRGTGNDFLKTFGTESIEKFRELKLLTGGVVKPLDVIKCIAENDSGQDIRYGINICSVGIDARIGTDVHKYTGIPVIGKSMGYNISLLVNVIKGIAKPFLITAGNHVFDGKYTLACVCNGRYYGGGFNPVPDALPDDGILDCLVVEGVSRFQVAKIVGKYAKGRFAEYPDVFNYIRCNKMTIEAEKEFVINVDGEAMYSKKITFELVRKGVNFLFPKDVY